MVFQIEFYEPDAPVNYSSPISEAIRVMRVCEETGSHVLSVNMNWGSKPLQDADRAETHLDLDPE